MSSLESYNASLDYSYAPGVFPSMECLKNRPGHVRRLLIHSKAESSDGIAQLKAICQKEHIRIEEADKALRRISGKDNCFAAAVFDKYEIPLMSDANHVVLHNPSDQGNVGTILRSCLGFGIDNIALIRPCADVFDPKVIRASMGAMFSMNVKLFDTFEAYREAYPAHALYPFMLDGSVSLDKVAIRSPYTLVFGNEGKGLPGIFQTYGQAVRIPHGDKIDSLNLSIAAAIGVYTFTSKERE